MYNVFKFGMIFFETMFACLFFFFLLPDYVLCLYAFGFMDLYYLLLF